MALAVLVTSLSALRGTVFGGAAAPAPDFDLPRWKTAERVRLADFAGAIVVLDFFAYWCAPCAGASRELEREVQQYYAARGGNARGVPVRVISVNVETDYPRRTEEFLQQTGASYVVTDEAGGLLEGLGGAGIPFLVVLDGSRATPGSGEFAVAYRQAGFAGARRLRQVIDKLGPARGETVASPSGGELSSPVRGGPRSHTAQTDAEFLFASDILVVDATARYAQALGGTGTEWEAMVGYASIGLDYQPNTEFDPFGFPVRLEEERWSAQFDLRQRVGETVTWLGAAGLYSGYPDYRRVWIANRYRQKYDPPAFTRIPGYEEPDPRGFNLSTGARWEYLRSRAFAEVRLGYARDHTAPGYDDSTNRFGDYRLEQGRKRLDTKSVRISSENVLTRRARLLNEFTLTDVSGRELRYAYQGSLNVALRERWVLRGHGGITAEPPDFDAHFFGLTVEFEVGRNLLVSLAGRYYQDTGEVFDPTLLSDAAPPLKSWEAGLGVRYAWANSSVKIYVAPFRTEYERKGVAFESFRHLYTDRNWGLAQVAYALQF